MRQATNSRKERLINLLICSCVILFIVIIATMESEPTQAYEHGGVNCEEVCDTATPEPGGPTPDTTPEPTGEPTEPGGPTPDTTPEPTSPPTSPPESTPTPPPGSTPTSQPGDPTSPPGGPTSTPAPPNPTNTPSGSGNPTYTPGGPGDPTPTSPAGNPDCNCSSFVLSGPEYVVEGTDPITFTFEYSSGGCTADLDSIVFDNFNPPDALNQSSPVVIPNSQSGSFHLQSDFAGELTFRATLNFHNASGSYSCPESKTLNVVNVDLDIWNGGNDLDNGEAIGQPGLPVPEADEMDVGAFILLNWDDDNSNGTPVPDLSENGIVNNEDNLGRLDPIVSPIPDDGVVELSISGVDADKIKLWESPFKGNEIPLTSGSRQWTLSNQNEKSEFQGFMNGGIWIEGIAPGTILRGVTIQLQYTDSSGAAAQDTATCTVVFVRLGSAVYRGLGVTGNDEKGHAAIFYSMDQDIQVNETDLSENSNFRVLQSMDEDHGDGPVVQNYTTITDDSDNPHWEGCYEPPDYSYEDRLRALVNGKHIWDLRTYISYPPGFATNVLVSRSEGVETWNGNYSDIDLLRCDALVEAVFEKPGAFISNVWGKEVEGVLQFSIAEHADIHNDQNYLWGWEKYFLPATQSGHTTPQGSATTTFVHREFVVEPGILQ